MRSKKIKSSIIWPKKEKSSPSTTPLSSPPLITASISSLPSFNSPDILSQQENDVQQNAILSILKDTWPKSDIKVKHLCLDIINYISANYIVQEIGLNKTQTKFKHYVLREDLRKELLSVFPDMEQHVFFTDFNIGKLLKIAIKLIDENELVKFNCKITLENIGEKRCYVNLKKINNN